jgi:hypothetical protein
MNKPHGDVSIEVAGKRYHGSYTVFGRKGAMITVSGLGELWGRTKTTQLGGSTPESLARIILHNMVEDKATGFGGRR